MEGQEQRERPGTAPCVLPSCPGLPGIPAGARVGLASGAGPRLGSGQPAQPAPAAAQLSCSPQTPGSEL